VTFDPDQPRDPDGKWGSGGGMPDVISGVSLTLGGLHSSVESRKGDLVRIGIGSASIEVTRGPAGRLVSILSSKSDNGTVYGEDRKPAMRVRYTAKGDKKARHDAEIEMVGQGVTAKVSHTELQQLRAAATVALLSRRLEIESGPTDVFIADRAVGVRTPAGVMRFDQKSWSRLLQAEGVVHEGSDEMGDFGPEFADVDQLVVKTNEGNITIMRHGDPSTSEGTLITWGADHADDWFVTHTGHHQDPWFQATGELQDEGLLKEISKELTFSDEDEDRGAGAGPHRSAHGGIPMIARTGRRGNRGRLTHRAFGYVDRSAMSADMPLRVVMASEGRMADGIDLRMAGARLERYQGNPVLGYGHSYIGRDNLPIGRANPNSLKVEGANLAGDIEFDQEDPFAREVERKMRAGYLNAVSVGFEVTDWDPAARGVASGWELTELSVVPVPMDASALVTAGRGLADPELLSAVRGCDEDEFARLLVRLRALNNVLAGRGPYIDTADDDIDISRPPVAGVPNDAARSLLAALKI
jgi:HK97 family phage prohead protease